MKISVEMATSTEHIMTQTIDYYKCLMDAKRSEPQARKQLLKAFTDKPISTNWQHELKVTPQ